MMLNLVLMTRSNTSGIAEPFSETTNLPSEKLSICKPNTVTISDGVVRLHNLQPRKPNVSFDSVFAAGVNQGRLVRAAAWCIHRKCVDDGAKDGDRIEALSDMDHK